jgi:hypothetical protein
MERTTVEALDCLSISTDQLLAEINSAGTALRERIQNLGKKAPRPNKQIFPQGR